MKKSPLRKALALIDTPEKWIKHRYENEDDGRYCVIGACHAANVRSWPLVLILHNFVGQVSVVEFNDARRRKHEDIMALFDLAIAYDEVGEL